MKSKEILPYIYDFLSIVFDKTTDIENVILFGSFARGNFTKKSDIDLFFDVTHNIRKVRNLVSDSIYEFEVQTKTKWKPRGIDFPIRAIVDNLNEKKWKPLKRDMISEGITLFGKFESLPKNMEHYAMCIYRLDEIKPKEKVKIIRKLFGYKTRKKNRIYVQKGLLEKLNGKKLSKNIILIPIIKTNEIFEFFNRHKVKTTIQELWMESDRRLI